VLDRESILENLAGDLEYHPRRAATYLVLSAMAFVAWGFAPAAKQFTAGLLLVALGGLALLIKGVYLLRKSSEGFGLTEHDESALAEAAKKKPLPPLPAQAGQIVQDFGTGGVLLWPLLRLGPMFNHIWENPPEDRIISGGAILFGLGWLIRRLTSNTA
jgi:hypothetical protein